jgi:hypothetical protein
MTQVIRIKKVVRCPVNQQLTAIDDCEICKFRDPGYYTNDKIGCNWDEEEYV